MAVQLTAPFDGFVALNLVVRGLTPFILAFCNIHSWPKPLLNAIPGPCPSSHT